MTQEASGGSGEVAETLALDAARLHAAQNAFQVLVVQATCLLLLAQAQSGRPLSDMQGECQPKQQSDELIAEQQQCACCCAGLLSLSQSLAHSQCNVPGLAATDGLQPCWADNLHGGACAPLQPDVHVRPLYRPTSLPPYRLSDWGMLAGVKARVAVLLADPSSKLGDIAAELARLAAAESPSTTATAASMEAALQRMLTPQGPGLKVLKNTLSQALLACLLSGPEAQLDRLLARVGAAPLQREIVELAESLGQIAAIGEAVHGPVFDALSSDLL